jgi:hypothetical protein
VKDTKDVVACVLDFGMFIHVARRLGAEYKKVYYTTPCDDAFPRIKDWVIGDEYPEIEWVESWLDVVDEIDLAVCPDVGYSAEQRDLRRRGIAVWGCGDADALEVRRGLFLKTLGKTRLPMPKHQKVQGLTNLRLLLKNGGDKYIKVSTWRGDFETFHFRSMEEDGQTLAQWECKLGPLMELVSFYVFDPIETKIEGGCDGWNINGQWPKTFIQGFENKDKSYLMTFKDWYDLPEEIRVVNEEFGPILKQYNYRGMFSTEVRITEDGKSYFLDPTCRFASPVSQAQCDMIGNLGEIVWLGANGIMCEPEQKERFGVQAVFQCDRSEWTILKLPKLIERHVKVSYSCMVDGMVCVPPTEHGPSEIGWLCATGSTIERAIEDLKLYAREMPSGIEVRIDSLADLLKEIKEAEKQGMEFTNEPVPEPAIVTED